MRLIFGVMNLFLVLIAFFGGFLLMATLVGFVVATLVLVVIFLVVMVLALAARMG